MMPRCQAEKINKNKASLVMENTGSTTQSC